MADRSHSKIENGGNGRYLNLETIQNLISLFKENITDNLSDEDIVKINLDDVSNEIFKTFFKWHKFTVTCDELKNPRVNIEIIDDHIQVIFEDQTYQVKIKSSIKDQLQENYKLFNKKFLNFSSYVGVD